MVPRARPGASGSAAPRACRSRGASAHATRRLRLAETSRKRSALSRRRRRGVLPDSARRSSAGSRAGPARPSGTRPARICGRTFHRSDGRFHHGKPHGETRRRRRAPRSGGSYDRIRCWAISAGDHLPGWRRAVHAAGSTGLDGAHARLRSPPGARPPPPRIEPPAHAAAGRAAPRARLLLERVVAVGVPAREQRAQARRDVEQRKEEAPPLVLRDVDPLVARGSSSRLRAHRPRARRGRA